MDVAYVTFSYVEHMYMSKIQKNVRENSFSLLSHKHISILNKLEKNMYASYANGMFFFVSIYLYKHKLIACSFTALAFVIYRPNYFQ